MASISIQTPDISNIYSTASHATEMFSIDTQPFFALSNIFSQSIKSLLDRISEPLVHIRRMLDYIMKPIQQMISNFVEHIAKQFHYITTSVRTAIISFFKVDEAQLDVHLRSSFPQYSTMRKSAWKALRDKNTEDYARQAAISMRETYNSFVKKKDYREYIEKKLGRTDKDLVEYIVGLDEDVVRGLNKQCHTKKVEEVVDLELIFHQAQFILFALFNSTTLESRFAHQIS